jgi:hypothetical protein
MANYIDVQHIMKIGMTLVVFVEYSLEAFIILVAIWKNVLSVETNSQFVNVTM